MTSSFLKYLIAFITVLHFQNLKAQDSTAQLKNFLIPAGFICYGIIAQGSPALNKFDENIKTSLKSDSKVKMDDYLWMAPISSLYILNLSGIKGKSSIGYMTLKGSMSALLANGFTRIIKNTADKERPDKSDRLSFSSGHTANAFMAAEIVHQEFGHRSVFYSIGAYSIASTVAYLRIRNNKHWFSDVVAGAGVGLISTKLSYWVYPKLSNKFRSEKTKNIAISPVLNGLGLRLNFE